ncbi:MAG: diaminopimelate epimerase [Kiritimatiellia bacterium]
MSTPFWKMHGAGNDFIILNRINSSQPQPTAIRIHNWCQPHTGIGADGLILLQSANNAAHHFRMTFFNPDGGEAEMCGNGARCIARFAYEQGIAPPNMKFETAAGVISARVERNLVTIDMQIPNHIEFDQQLEIDNHPLLIDFVNTGVPHAVVICPDLAAIDIPTLGRAIRQHARYAPAGTNVDFIQIAENNTLQIRTYERGVEAETLACGTGIAAAATICILKGIITSPASIVTAGGDTLHVALEQQSSKITRLQLTGPAKHVFHGTITDDPFNGNSTCS